GRASPRPVPGRAAGSPEWAPPGPRVRGAGERWGRLRRAYPLAGLPRWSVSPGHREQALSRRTPGRWQHPASFPARWPSRRGDPARTRRRGDGMSVGDITADAAGEVTGQRPELVQLLTPEGERVEHPGYAL